MDLIQGKLLLVWALATPVAWVLGWWLARRFRRALVVLMRTPRDNSGGAAPPAPGASAALRTAEAAAALPAWQPRALPTPASWQRAEWRLLAFVCALSLLMALSRGVITHWGMPELAWSWPRVLLLSTLMAWPLLPAVAMLRRWPRQRLVMALAAWLVLAWALAMWRSTQAQDGATVVLWLAWEVLPPALAFVLLTVPAARAAAPWLWPPVALLLLAAIGGLDTLVWVHATRPQWLMALPDGLNPWWLFAAFALAAVALGWWPVQRLARLLARAYARRWVSDLMVLFFSVWALALGFDALSSGPWVLLPLLWIPLGMALMARLAPRDAAAAPTLLVLRVFQQDVNVSALFDDVVERWRCIGNTVLIAGTDVVGHTLDASDLFDFLDGRLGARFVHGADDVPRRLQGFDWLPDAEGRFRVNECYCHDNGWQVALTALAGRSDAVLMDLRGFQAHNAGCRFELGVIARAVPVQRVVVLSDAATDMATARADAAAAADRRFVWIEVPQGARRGATARQVIAALAGQAPPQAVARSTTPTPA